MGVASNVFLKIAGEKRLISDEALAELTEASGENGSAPERLAVERGLIKKEDLLRALENYFFHPSVDIPAAQPDPAALLVVPKIMAKRFEALPLSKNGDVLVIAMARPEPDVISNLKSISKCSLEIRVAQQADLNDAIIEHYTRIEEELKPALSPTSKIRPPDKAASQPDKMGETATNILSHGSGPGSVLGQLIPELATIARGEGSAPKVVEALLKKSVELRATDIHIEPARHELVVRLRIDGVLQLAVNLPGSITPSLTSRTKVVSGMDIAEKRSPQDGRYSLEYNQEIVDCRVSSLPSRWGEKIVIRLLKKDVNLIDLDKIQMPPPLLEKWRELLKLPIGMILVTGPTGSGKTTTLYATIASLDRESTNIVTLEDPIEYEMPGITQVQINTRAGMTFEAGLRSILRQDPDTVLVGEIRDSETVEIAARAALTGHKMFSTLHTNDAASAVIRLLDMGVAPYLLTAALKGVIAQRLLRTICPTCDESYKPSDIELARLGYPKIEVLHRGAGCSACSGTGYMGRQAAYELLVIDESHDLGSHFFLYYQTTRCGSGNGSSCRNHSSNGDLRENQLGGSGESCLFRAG